MQVKGASISSGLTFLAFSFSFFFIYLHLTSFHVLSENSLFLNELPRFKPWICLCSFPISFHPILSHPYPSTPILSHPILPTPPPPQTALSPWFNLFCGRSVTIVQQYPYKLLCLFFYNMFITVVVQSCISWGVLLGQGVIHSWALQPRFSTGSSSVIHNRAIKVSVHDGCAWWVIRLTHLWRIASLPCHMLQWPFWVIMQGSGWTDDVSDIVLCVRSFP